MPRAPSGRRWISPGIILTKADGDARGGAALSVREVTGKPIVFLGVGEKTEALEPFDPERMASRILGMGDVVSLVEQVHRKVDVEEAERLAHKVASGKDFNMTDLRGQLRAAAEDGRHGGGAGQAARGAWPKKGAVSADQGDKELRRQIAIIDSMTPRERRNPGIIDGSRRRRIAAGLRGAGPGRQPAAQAVHGDAADDEEHEGREAAPDDGGHGGMLPGSGGPICSKPLDLRRIRALFGRPFRGPRH